MYALVCSLNYISSQWARVDYCNICQWTRDKSVTWPIINQWARAVHGSSPQLSQHSVYRCKAVIFVHFNFFGMGNVCLFGRLPAHFNDSGTVLWLTQLKPLLTFSVINCRDNYFSVEYFYCWLIIYIHTINYWLLHVSFNNLTVHNFFVFDDLITKLTSFLLFLTFWRI